MNFDVLCNENKEKLKFYNPYNFDRNIDADLLFKEDKKQLTHYLNKNLYKEISVKDTTYYFFYQKLNWDTTFFGIETYRIYNVLSLNYCHLNQAISAFVNSVLPLKCYCFIEIPAEDTELIQALGSNGFKLIETRLTYYNHQLQNHNHPRFNVRQATANDIENLKHVASQMRNNFDRFHADKTFDVKQADEFLSTYIENSVLGFADYVMLPNEKQIPSDSFLTANYLKHDWENINYSISKMVLSAVSASTNKGWYIKLISEMLYHLRDSVGSQCVYLNTQASNRAVYSTWEKLGFKLGCTNHIISFTK